MFNVLREALLLFGIGSHSHNADVDHREIVGSALLVACGDATELLEAVDQAFNFVALPIRLTIKVRLRALILAGRDHR